MQIFLCHSSSDKKYVRELYSKLVSDGYDVWLDEVNLIPGQQWDPEIRRQVRKSDVVLVCLSENSWNKEGYIQREINIALDEADAKPENTIYIIPARIELCIVPDRLAKWQWVDLFSEGGYEKLKLALNIRSAQVKKRNAQTSSAAKVLEINSANVGYQKNDIKTMGAEQVSAIPLRGSFLGKVKPIIIIILFVALVYSLFRYYELQNAPYQSSTVTLQGTDTNNEKLLMNVFYPKYISPGDNWTITVKIENVGSQTVSTDFDLSFNKPNVVIVTEDGTSSVSINNLRPRSIYTHTFNVKTLASVEDSVQFRVLFNNSELQNISPTTFHMDVSNQKFVFMATFAILLFAILWMTLRPELLRSFKSNLSNEK